MSNRSLAQFALQLLLTAWLGAPAAATAQDVPVVVEGGIPRYLPLAPGGTTTFTFELRNGTTAALGGAFGGLMDSPAATLASYTFTAADPAQCEAPTVVPRVSYNLLHFPVAAVAPGTTRKCRYLVTRAPGAGNDLGFEACWARDGAFPGFCAGRVRLGTLPDLDLSLETLGAGSGDTTLLRLRLHNRSAIDVESRVASTHCHEFDGGFVEPVQFDVDGNTTGGCPIANNVHCINFTGVFSVSRAFQLGPVPAGGSSTCLLRVRRMRAEGAAQVPLFLNGDGVALPAGAIGFDPRRDGERVLVGLGLPGAVPVPLGPIAPPAIAIAVMFAGLHALRRRRGRVQSA